MGIFDSAFDSVGGMLQDQWKDIITAGRFDELTLVAPGERKRGQNGRGANRGAEDVLSNGSQIFVPENTAAFIFSEGGIEQVITQPGTFTYQNGELSVFSQTDRQQKGMVGILVGNAVERFGYSGMSPQEKRVAFVNLREIRGVKFGTRGPLVYHDGFYGTDLEVYSFGSISLRIVDPVVFVQQFLPPNAQRYSLKRPAERQQLVSEFLHSFVRAVNLMSAEYRISQLPGLTNEIAEVVAQDPKNAGTWPARYGLALSSIGIENIEFSDESRELIRNYSEKKMSVAAYENVSKHAADVAAQQTIAQGVMNHGLGDGGGMLFGMNLAQGLNPTNAGYATPFAGGGNQAQGRHAAQASSEPSNQKDTDTPSQANESPGTGEYYSTEAASDQAGDRSDDSSAQASKKAEPSFEEKAAKLKTLKELLDAGILTQEEFDAKKRQILGL